MDFSLLSDKDLNDFLTLYGVRKITSRNDLIKQARDLWLSITKLYKEPKATEAIVDLYLSVTYPIEVMYSEEMVRDHLDAIVEHFHLPPGSLTRVVRILALSNKYQIFTTQPVVSAIPSATIVNVIETLNIDPFDQITYQAEHALIGKYWQGPEALIRAAGYILYKYGRLATRVERMDLDREVVDRGQEYLDDLTGVIVPENMVKYWYKHYNLAKATDEHVTRLLWKYTQAYDTLFNTMYRKYVDSNYDRYAYLHVVQHPPTDRDRPMSDIELV